MTVSPVSPAAQDPWFESQIVGVVVGALLTALIAVVGALWKARREKQRARARLISDVESQYLQCNRLVALMGDFNELSHALVIDARDKAGSSSFEEQLFHFKDRTVARRVRQWYAHLRLHLTATTVLTEMAVRVLERGGVMPETHPRGVAATLSYFRKLGRWGRRVSVFVHAADRWWSRPGYRRLRRGFRRRFRRRRHALRQ